MRASVVNIDVRISDHNKLLSGKHQERWGRRKERNKEGMLMMNGREKRLLFHEILELYKQ